jgi:hypothetical protein
VGVGVGAGAGVGAGVGEGVGVGVGVGVGEGEGSHLLSRTLALYQDLGSYGQTDRQTDSDSQIQNRPRQTVTDKYKIDHCLSLSLSLPVGLSCIWSIGWRRPIGCLKLQVIFRKRATNYRALLRKMTCKDKASYESSPLSILYLCLVFVFLQKESETER